MQVTPGGNRACSIWARSRAADPAGRVSGGDHLPAGAGDGLPVRLIHPRGGRAAGPMKDAAAAIEHVAVDRRGKNGDITDFIDCVAFNKNAEMLVEYFRKGKPIRAVGSMECDPYTAKDGTKRYPWTLKIECWGFDAADPKGAVAEKKPDVSEAFEDADDSDDVPF